MLVENLKKKLGGRLCGEAVSRGEISDKTNGEPHSNKKVQKESRSILNTHYIMK